MVLKATCLDVTGEVSLDGTVVWIEPWNTLLGGGKEDEAEPAKELSRSSQRGGR